MHPGTQIHGRSSLVSLDAPLTSEAGGEDIMCLHEALASRSEDPSMAATRRLDWASLVDSLDGNAREVLGCLVIGEDLTSLKPKLCRSRSAIQTDKERLARMVREYLGTDILVQVQEQPRWKDNVETSRAKLACRYERQPA
jgi:predicted trehalose synthase